jgi:opacity protein-like surface antigen
MTIEKALCAVVALVAALAAPAGAAGSPEDQAQAAAEAWLKLVDAGSFDASWDQAARLFKGAVTRDQWSRTVAGVRSPLGKVLSRKVGSRKYAESLPGAPDGKYVVLQFETAFAHKATAVETITPMLDPDGVWRVSGYFIR